MSHGTYLDLFTGPLAALGGRTAQRLVRTVGRVWRRRAAGAGAGRGILGRVGRAPAHGIHLLTELAGARLFGHWRRSRLGRWLVGCSVPKVVTLLRRQVLRVLGARDRRFRLVLLSLGSSLFCGSLLGLEAAACLDMQVRWCGLTRRADYAQAVHPLGGCEHVRGACVSSRAWSRTHVHVSIDALADLVGGAHL